MQGMSSRRPCHNDTSPERQDLSRPLRPLTSVRMCRSTAAESYLKGDFWHVPDKPAVPAGKIGRNALRNLAAYMMPANGRKFRQQAGAVASVAVAGLVAAVSVGLFVTQQYQSQAH